MDASWEVDVHSILVEAPLPTPASEPSYASRSSKNPGASTASQPTRINEAITIKVGH